MGKSDFEIGERASQFGETVIDFVLPLRSTPVSSPLISQLVRAGTSIGANLAEADESDTRKEFLYRLSLSRREARETQHWLRMLARALPEQANQSRRLWHEAEEIKRILSAIGRNTRRNAETSRRSANERR